MLSFISIYPNKYYIIFSAVAPPLEGKIPGLINTYVNDAHQNHGPHFASVMVDIEASIDGRIIARKDLDMIIQKCKHVCEEQIKKRILLHPIGSNLTTVVDDTDGDDSDVEE